MNLDNFTIKSQEAIQQAQQVAIAHEHQAVEPAHLLKGMMEVDKHVIPFILKKLDVNPDEFSKEVDSIVLSYPRVSGAKQYLSDETNKVLQKALVYMNA